MRRISVAAIAMTLALSGCPLPQPLPTYPAGTVTPPNRMTKFSISSDIRLLHTYLRFVIRPLAHPGQSDSTGLLDFLGESHYTARHEQDH